MGKKRILEELAEFAVGLRFEGLSNDLKRQANRCFLDLVGCYFAAFAIEGNRRLLELAPDLNPKPEATIWGMGFKAGMAESALDREMIQAWFHLFEKGIENDESLEETLGLLSRSPDQEV